MSPKGLPTAYLKKVKSRLRALDVLYEDQNYSDVVRESQEVVELCSKAIVRLAGMEPLHQHDVGSQLKDLQDKLVNLQKSDVDQLIEDGHWLRREREISFYGAEDFDPTEGYSVKDADEAKAAAVHAVMILSRLLTDVEI